MAKGDLLGEFEQIVLLAVVRLGNEAYGMTVRREIEGRTGRLTSIGAVYRTLSRLEKKGLLSSGERDPTPVRGGKAKRFYELGPVGARALRLSRQMLDSMWEGVEVEGRA